MPPKPATFTPAARNSQASAPAGAEYAGTVTLMVVVSDKGFPCDAQVLGGLDKAADQKAVVAVRQWNFKPATKDGRPVPVVVTVGVDFWRREGELVVAKVPAPDPPQSPK